MTTALPSLHRCRDCGHWFLDHPAPKQEAQIIKQKGKKKELLPELPVDDFVTHLATCRRPDEPAPTPEPSRPQPQITVTIPVSPCKCPDLNCEFHFH